MAAGAAFRAADFAEQWNRGWRWWTGELAAMVPARVREFFAGDDAIVAISLIGDELFVTRESATGETTVARIPRDQFAARTLSLSARARPGLLHWLDDPIILRLPADDALVRNIRLPKAARRNLDDILRHEIARQSPIDASAIYFDYRVTGSDAAGMDIALRIVRRDTVDPIAALCREAGVALSAVAFSGDRTPADGGSLPADVAAAREFRLRPKIVPALALSCLALIVVLIASAYLRGQEVGDNLSQRIDAASTEANAVARLERALDVAHRQIAFLSEEKRAPGTAAVLAEVSRVLPDDSWLTEFELNGDEVRIHGYSATAPSLLAQFDASPLFAEAQFRSPLMQGPKQGVEQFDISLRLRRTP